MDIKQRAAFLKFIGELIANPAKFNEHLKFEVASEDATGVRGTFHATGPIAEFFKGGGHGKGQMEKKG